MLKIKIKIYYEIVLLSIEYLFNLSNKVLLSFTGTIGQR